jgi:hypothetical protein
MQQHKFATVGSPQVVGWYLEDSDLGASVIGAAMTAVTGGVTQSVTVTPN